MLENDVYSSPGDGSKTRLNSLLDCFFLFLYNESFVFGWNATFTSLFFLLAPITDLPPPWNCTAIISVPLNLSCTRAEAVQFSLATKPCTNEIRRGLQQFGLTGKPCLTIYLLHTGFSSLRIHSRVQDMRKGVLFTSLAADSDWNRIYWESLERIW